MASLTDVGRRHGHPGVAVDGKIVIPRLHFHMRLALEELKFIPQMGDGFIFFLQRFGLQDGLTFRLCEVVLTYPGDLMQGASGAWLDTITLSALLSGCRRAG